MTSSSPGFQALVCITSCLRLERLRRYLPHYAEFCSRDPRFCLLVSLDGKETEYLSFCDEWQIPLVYSDEREGVGMSKNRVLTRYPDFDYYFFIEDDVELVDSEVFPIHIELSRRSGIHHFSLFERGGVRKQLGESRHGGIRVVHGMYGGAHFNFFTREGLARVGGWHPRFTKYRRGGHTEHSLRFMRRRLAPAPFNVAEDWADAFIWHVPPAVTLLRDVECDADQIARPERELIDEQLEYVPVTTVSRHHVNSYSLGPPRRLASTLRGGDRYPILASTERRRAWSDYHLWRGRTADSLPARVANLLRGVLEWPGNPVLRQLVRALCRTR